MKNSHPRLVVPCMVIGLLGAMLRPLPGQCGEELVPRAPVPGTNRWVNAMTWWDPDGPGPRTPLVVLVGKFWTAGAAHAPGVAVYDPVTGEFGGLGEGMGATFEGPVAVAALPGGDLVVGGDFTDSGTGTPLNHLARWDGTSWQALGGGTNGTVYSLLVRANGDLVVGGAFTATGGVPNYCVGVWNGSAWSSLPSNLNGPVSALAEMPNGDLVAGGSFSLPGGSIARHDGVAWRAMGAGFSAAPYAAMVNALAVMPNGTLVAGGQLRYSGSTALNNLARWSGTAWLPVDPGNAGMRNVLALQVMANGNLLVGGYSNCIRTGHSVGSWDGTSWTTYGPLSYYDEARCVLELPKGEMLAGGYFSIVGGNPIWSIPGQPIWNIRRWEGTAWRALGSAPNMGPWKLATRPNGDVVAAGGFTMIGGTAATYIARWDGIAWHSMASPFDPASGGPPKALLPCSNGDVYIAGDYALASGGGPPYRLFRWDGATWSGVGLTVNQSVLALAELPNGNMVAAGYLNSVGGITLNGVGRWDGTTWHPFDQGVLGVAKALAVLPNGDLVVGGQFTTNGSVAASNIACWDGSSWHAMPGPGAPLDVDVLTALPNGDILAAGRYDWGSFGQVEAVCRWDGSSWSWVARLGSEVCYSMTRLSGGSVQITGGFDVVIANPPYMRMELIKDQKDDLQKAYPDVFDGRADLYVYFYARGLDLLRPGGMLSFISSDKFFRAGYGEGLRNVLAQQTVIHSTIDFGELPVFEATVEPAVIIARKIKPTQQHSITACNIDSMELLERLVDEVPVRAWKLPQNELRSDGWTLETPAILKIIEKMRAAGKPLGELIEGKFYMGFKSGLNDAFVIDQETYQTFLNADPKNAEIIKPLLRGQDIQRWAIEWANLYVIFAYHGIG